MIRARELLWATCRRTRERRPDTSETSTAAKKPFRATSTRTPMIRTKNIPRREPPVGIVTVDLGGKRRVWDSVVESKESKYCRTNPGFRPSNGGRLHGVAASSKLNTSTQR